jgi:hypothetical protein
VKFAGFQEREIRIRDTGEVKAWIVGANRQNWNRGMLGPSLK